MSNNRRYSEAKEMMYVATEHLFSAASPDCLDVQDQAHMMIVGMVSHASQMATTAHEGAAEMLSAVQPMVDEVLPTTQRELAQLRQRLELAQSRIRDISFRVLMERQRETLARAMPRHLH
jgi:hypothetical protein